jgi:hypothetical protein
VQQVSNSTPSSDIPYECSFFTIFFHFWSFGLLFSSLLFPDGGGGLSRNDDDGDWRRQLPCTDAAKKREKERIDSGVIS